VNLVKQRIGRGFWELGLEIKGKKRVEKECEDARRLNAEMQENRFENYFYFVSISLEKADLITVHLLKDIVDCL